MNMIGHRDTRISVCIGCALLSFLLTTDCDSRNSGRRIATEAVRIVQVPGSPQSKGELFDLALDLELGIEDGDPDWQIFTFVTDALATPDGRMVIADRGRLEVYIIRPDGTLQARVGGRGEGPGEFLSIWGLMWSWAGREFWVWDMNLVRFNCYSLDGEFLRAQFYGRQEELYDHFISLNDGRFLALTLGDPVDGSMSRYTIVDEELKVIGDFIEVPGPRVWKDPKLGGYGAIPYTELDGVAALQGGRILSYHPYGPRLTVYDREGDPLRHLDLGWELPRVTAAEKEQFRSKFRDNPANAHFAHWATDMPIPDQHAAFDLVLTDDRDRIWIRRIIPRETGGEPSFERFEVLTAEGAWLGSQDLPYRPVTIQGDHVYCLYSDDSGAPRFGRFRLNPNPETQSLNRRNQ
jgi:hypothetical protein